MAGADVERRLDAGDVRMTSIEERLAELRSELRANTDLTRDIREVLETGRALFRFAAWVARISAWLAPIVAATAAAWVAWKSRGTK